MRASARRSAEKCPKCGGAVLHGRKGAKVCSDDACDYYVWPPSAATIVLDEVPAVEHGPPSDMIRRQQEKAMADYFVALLAAARRDTEVADLGEGFVIVIDSGKVHVWRRDHAAGYLRSLSIQLEGGRRG